MSRQSLDALTAGTALWAAPWAGAAREPAWAGPGATRGVATGLEAAPTDASGGERGGRSPAARPTARPAAFSRAASPALRPGLTETRRRKRRRGPLARRLTHPRGADLQPAGSHVIPRLPVIPDLPPQAGNNSCAWGCGALRRPTPRRSRTRCERAGSVYGSVAATHSSRSRHALPEPSTHHASRRAAW